MRAWTGSASAGVVIVRSTRRGPSRCFAVMSIAPAPACACGTTTSATTAAVASAMLMPITLALGIAGHTSDRPQTVKLRGRYADKRGKPRRSL